MQPPDASDRAGELLARLLADPQFRADFRRDPAAACAAFGLPGLGVELEGGKALHTLELRESRSSLAGVMLAAAAEGVGVAEFFRHYHGGAALTTDASRAVEKAMTSPSLRAVTPSVPAPPVVPEPPAPGPTPAEPPVQTPESSPAAGLSPPAGVEPDTPATSPVPGTPTTTPGGGDPSAGVDSAPRAPESVVPDGQSAPMQQGVPPVAESVPEPDVLASPRLVMDGQTHDALEASIGDPAVAGVLATLTREHTVTVALSSSDTGGPAFDVVSVDGKPVEAANIAARDLAAALAELDPQLRPVQVVTPWPIDSEGFVTDEAHAERLHLVFAATPAPGARGTATFGAADAGAQPHQTLGAVPAAGPEEPPEQPPSHEQPPPTEPGDEPSTPAAQSLESLDTDGPNPYPGDDAPREQIAVWMAREAHKAGLPGELPVMAALVESNVKNLPGGDADSMGFFQMRESIWNQGEYAGYGSKPELQLRWFIDHALDIRTKRIAAGDNGFGHDSAAWGNWIADVERPYEPYRGRYQLRLEEARELLKSAIPSEAVSDQHLSEPDAGSSSAAGAIAVAMRYRGTPYRWGGETPETGFDCSGLVQYAFAQEDVHLPRVAEDQFGVGEHISRDDLRPGDLVFFQNPNGYIHHVGIYLGDDRFLHAPHTGDVIKVSSLDSPYYTQQFAGGRRVLEAVDTAPPSPAEPTASGPPPAPPKPPRSSVQFLPAVKPEDVESP